VFLLLVLLRTLGTRKTETSNFACCINGRNFPTDATLPTTAESWSPTHGRFQAHPFPFHTVVDIISGQRRLPHTAVRCFFVPKLAIFIRNLHIAIQLNLAVHISNYPIPVLVTAVSFADTTRNSKKTVIVVNGLRA
jgi:hypothetical protein